MESCPFSSFGFQGGVALVSEVRKDITLFLLLTEKRFFRQEGGVSVAVVAFLSLMLIAGLFLFDVSCVYLAREKARSAADAAAKAAGLEITPLFKVGNDPERAAEEYARRHGCRLEGFWLGGDGRYQWVEVKVARDVKSLLIPTRSGKVFASARCYLDLEALSIPRGSHEEERAP